MKKIINLKLEDCIKESIEKIKTPEDILQFMDNIRYGYVDSNNEIHLNTLKGFRKTYITLSIKDILKYKVGTCIEQVFLMKYLLDMINVKNKMFCTRIYEPNIFDDLNAEEHMHCFILYYINDRVYHIEHPNPDKVGIYEYKDEEDALKRINDYYVNISEGVPRPVTEFFCVDEGLTFNEFNRYINSLDKIVIKELGK